MKETLEKRTELTCRVVFGKKKKTPQKTRGIHAFAFRQVSGVGHAAWKDFIWAKGPLPHHVPGGIDLQKHGSMVADHRGRGSGEAEARSMLCIDELRFLKKVRVYLDPLLLSIGDYELKGPLAVGFPRTWRNPLGAGGLM